MLGSVSIQTFQRWQSLHGTVVPAIIYQKLGKEGSGSSGRYYLKARFQQPQSGALYTRILTNRSTHDDLSVGQQVDVCYAHDPQQTLLSSEWSLTGKSVVIIVAGFGLLLNGLSANKALRKRRNGYLPE
ncbi:hypothetical protein GCM10027345_19250 [Hymenobacter daeguensis]